MSTVLRIAYLLVLGSSVAGLNACAEEVPSIPPLGANAGKTARYTGSGGPQVGMNLAGIIYYSSEWPLVDAFKTSRPWKAKKGEEIEVDEQGNPLLKAGQSADTLMLRELNGHYPAGIFVATYKGTGIVEIPPGFDRPLILRQTPGRIEFKVIPGNGGIALRVTSSSPTDPIRDIHVWMPGFENAKSPFHPLFLERLAPFSVIRFMDWQRTNNSPLEHWSQRPRLSDARYSNPTGVPLELMIDLANMQKADPWFCIPHQADDDFVKQFATLVKERLDPSRKIYIEYSNEVWNGQFNQARFAKEQGKVLGLSSKDYEAQLRYYSQRAVEIFAIWEKTFGGKERLVRVMGSQFGNPWVSEQVLGWKDAYKHVDTLAIAPYFGGTFGAPKTQEQVSKMTVDELLSGIEEEVMGKNRDMMQKHAQIAHKYKLHLVAYEGGQSLVGTRGAENNQALTNLFFAANREPRMGEIYRKHMSNWFTAGGTLYVAFSNVCKPSKWGSWGTMEYQDQPIEKAPKYQAIVEFAKKTSSLNR